MEEGYVNTSTQEEYMGELLYFKVWIISPAMRSVMSCLTQDLKVKVI